MAGSPAAATTPVATRSGTSRNGVLGIGRRLATETKHALKTTEFYAYVVTFVLILIAGNSIESAEGGPDRFAANDVWLYITILTVGYMVSRGLAKAGSREPGHHRVNGLRRRWREDDQVRGVARCPQGRSSQ